MTKDEIRQIADDLGVPYAKLARLIGVSKNTFSLWMSGEQNIAKSNARFLRLLSLRPELVVLLKEIED